MRFREETLRDVMRRLTELGLTSCPICDAEDSWHVDHRPVLLRVGGLKSAMEDQVEGDPEANVLLMVRVFCEVCGYSMLFDSEKHHGPDEPVLEGPPTFFR